MKESGLCRQALKFLKALLARVAVEEVARYGLYVLRTYFKMRCVDIDENLKPADAKIKNLSEVPNLKFVERDVIKGDITRNSEVPEIGRYKLISFHNGPSGVEVGIIRILNLFWQKATLAEVLYVGENADFNELGVGDGCFISGMGTEFKRASAIHSYCFPVIGFSLKKTEDGKLIKEKFIYLHDFDDNYPSGYYILFRTK